jgi:hypothetical protein
MSNIEPHVNFNENEMGFYSESADVTLLRKMLENQKVLALMPYTSDIYGCVECETFWVDNTTCWLCDQPGTLIANKIT